MQESSTVSRLPAGSTLEIAPGVHVAHPHAEVNLPGKPTGRFIGSNAVTESLGSKSEVDNGEIKSLGEQTPLHCEVVPGTLVAKNANMVLHVKEGHDAVQLLADQVDATKQPVVVDHVAVDTETN